MLIKYVGNVMMIKLKTKLKINNKEIYIRKTGS